MDGGSIIRPLKTRRTATEITPLMPTGPSTTNKCPSPSVHKIYKSYKLESYNIADPQEERFLSDSFSVTSRLFHRVAEAVSEKVHERDVQRVDLFASETTFIGFMDSLIMMPYRAISNHVDDAMPAVSFATFGPPNEPAYHGGSMSPKTVAMQPKEDPIIEALIKQYTGEPVCALGEPGDEQLLDFIAADLAHGVTLASLDCLRYYLVDQGLEANVRVEDQGKLNPEDDPVNNIPPSKFFETVSNLCRPKNFGASFQWDETFAALGVRYIPNSPHRQPLKKLLQRWKKYGDVFSPFYFQSALAMATTATAYWYLIPLTLWCTTAYCSSAPILIAHVPRLMIYILLINWRFFGLYVGIGRFEHHLTNGAFDFSDHVVIFTMQILILSLEMAAAARAIKVLRSHTGPPSALSRTLSDARRTLGAFICSRMKQSMEHTIDHRAIGKGATQLILNHSFSWVPRVIAGAAFSGMTRAIWQPEAYGFMYGMVLLATWPVLYLLGWMSTYLTYTVTGGCRMILIDCIDDDVTGVRTGDTSKGVARSLRMLYGVVHLCVFFIALSMYCCFYTALFYHTKMESFIGLIVGIVGLYLPVATMLYMDYLHPQTLGLVDRKDR